MANKFTRITRSLTELVNQLNDPRTIDSLAVNDKTALSPNTFSLKVNPVAKALTNWDLVKEEATTTQPPKKTIANDLTVFSAVQTATEKYPVRIITNDNPSIDLKTISETTFIWASKKDTTLRLFDRINNLRTGRDLGRAVGREAINVLSSGIAIIRYAQKSFSYDAGNSIISIEGESISLLNNVINEYVREQEEIRVASIAPATETLAGTTSEVLADDLNTRLTQAEASILLKAPLDSPALTGTPTAPTAAQGTNTTQVATTQFVTGAITTLIDGAPGVLDTLNEIAASIGDDPNFTGTITSSLALKAPLASPSFTGTVNFQTVSQTIVPLTGATGVVTHNLSNGAVFFHSSISANFTANFTNVPTTDDRGIGVALILNQGATPYLPTALQIDGSSVTIKWGDASAPGSGNANQVDIVSFTFVRTSSAWTALATLTTFG